jgi:hypothetical protein
LRSRTSGAGEEDISAAEQVGGTSAEQQGPAVSRCALTVCRVETWWPAILVALTDEVSNARTEGFNRIIKQTKRVGCGFRSQVNYQRRILSHIAVTRPQRSAA